MKTLRPLTENGSITEVPVYHRGLIVTAFIETADAPMVSKYLWSITGSGYVKTGKRGTSYSGYLHRLIMKPEPTEQVDHINGNKLDNRRSNLRIVSNQQNQMARHAVVSMTGYKGVHEHGAGFRAQIKYNQKVIRLGTYPTAEKAARAYNQAAIALFSEHAVINKIRK